MGGLVAEQADLLGPRLGACSAVLRPRLGCGLGAGSASLGGGLGEQALLGDGLWVGGCAFA